MLASNAANTDQGVKVIMDANHMSWHQKIICEGIRLPFRRFFFLYELYPIGGVVRESLRVSIMKDDVANFVSHNKSRKWLTEISITPSVSINI